MEVGRRNASESEVIDSLARHFYKYPSLAGCYHGLSPLPVVPS